MGIRVSTDRTDSYIGTFYKDNADDMSQLKAVRAIVKNMNASLRRSKFNYQFYVKCQGRGWRHGVPRYNQSLPLPLASHMDAYILSLIHI